MAIPGFSGGNTEVPGEAPYQKRRKAIMKYPEHLMAAYRPGPERVVIIGGSLMLMLLLLPLLFWFEGRAWGDEPVPDCDSLPVLSQLREAYPRVVHAPLNEIIRDVQSVGLDRRLGHRMCYARVGEGDQARRLKFAVSYQDDANDSVRIELVTD